MPFKAKLAGFALDSKNDTAGIFPLPFSASQECFIGEQIPKILRFLRNVFRIYYVFFAEYTHKSSYICSTKYIANYDWTYIRSSNTATDARQEGYHSYGSAASGKDHTATTHL